MSPAAPPQTAPFSVRATRWALLLIGSLGLTMIVVQTFNLSLFGIFPLLSNRYYYALVGLFLAAALLMPSRSRPGGWKVGLDAGLAVLALGSGAFLAWNAETIITEGWSVTAPLLPSIVSGVLVLLSLEAVRRFGGPALLVICGVFGAYPLFADALPGFLWGPSLSLTETVAEHAMGMESIIGIPLRVVADTLVGFIIFGCILSGMGGGRFFMDLSLALMGRTRGGPAKVAVISSALFGSLSGSVISNVLTTGRLTIPTMMRAGYPPTYAAAVESCASTGGTLMPPVMGAVAFIMASFLDTSYTTIMLAALVPSVLYYMTLLFQVDLYAARNGLGGGAEDEIQPLGRILADGWPHIVSLIALVVMLFTFSPSRAAYYATALMVALGFLRHRRLPSPAQVANLLRDLVGNIAYLVATLCGIGLVVGSLAITGVGSAFSRELILYGQGNVFLLLVLGAITSFVLGVGMTVSACYIFLATVLAPALVDLNLSPIGAHLFILYWGMLSYITPPVALASITAAQISGANGLKTGFMSMKLGVALFILPFMFVLQPALLLDGPISDVVPSIVTAALAIVVLASALEGYVYRLGAIALPERVVLFVAGLLIMTPDRQSEAGGLILLVLTLAAVATLRRSRTRREAGASWDRAARSREP